MRFSSATTDPHRIPPTIISRCQRYDFHRIPVSGIVGRLREIADADGIRITNEALEAAAGLADGALRDAISLLDQCRATFPGEIVRDDVLSLAGVVNDAFMYEMASAMAMGNAARAMALTDEMILDGRDVVRFTSDLAAYFRDVMMCKVTANPASLVRASTEALQGMKTIGGGYSLDALLEIIRVLSILLSELRWSPDPRTMFEITLIRILLASRSGRLEENEAPAPVTPPNQGQTLIAPAPVTQLPLPHDLAAPAPVTPPNQGQTQAAPAPVTPPDRERETVDIQLAWEGMLSTLCNEGQMLLYLYLRPARVSFADGRVVVMFHPDESLSQAEVTRKPNDSIMRDALAKAAGRPIDLVVRTEAELSEEASRSASWKDAEWVRKIRNSADEMGIPITYTE
jgi:DNA polymerase-3 subunit gamma/tau